MMTDICHKTMQTTTIIDLLGGDRVLGRGARTEAALSVSLRRGLPYGALQAMKTRLAMSDAEIA